MIYQDRVIHVASWAAKFLFTGEQLNQPVERLSGGERARVLIAQLMLQPADVLLLDEPTNDLDIPTLEILEESLLEFRGSLVLVTHDRYMLDRVSTIVLGPGWTRRRGKLCRLLAMGSLAGRRQGSQRRLRRVRLLGPKVLKENPPAKTRLSYLEAREYASHRSSALPTAEAVLQAKRVQLEDPAIASDGPRLLSAHAEMEEAQNQVDELYRALERAGKEEELRSLAIGTWRLSNPVGS